MLTAGPRRASASKPSMNSPMMRSARQASDSRNEVSAYGLLHEQLAVLGGARRIGAVGRSVTLAGYAPARTRSGSTPGRPMTDTLTRMDQHETIPTEGTAIDPVCGMQRGHRGRAAHQRVRGHHLLLLRQGLPAGVRGRPGAHPGSRLRALDVGPAAPSRHRGRAAHLRNKGVALRKHGRYSSPWPFRNAPVIPYPIERPWQVREPGGSFVRVRGQDHHLRRLRPALHLHCV